MWCHLALTVESNSSAASIFCGMSAHIRVRDPSPANAARPLPDSEDLLSRHFRLSHVRHGDVAPVEESKEDLHELSDFDGNGTTVDDPDLLFDPQLFMQDMLPPTLFDSDTNVPFTYVSARSQPPGPTDFPHFSSHLPDLDGAERQQSTDEDHGGAFTDHTRILPWSFSESTYEGFCLEIESYSAVLPHDWRLPSRNSLSRNLESYFRCAQESLPFLHSATFSVAKSDIELLLAAAAMGALNRFETSCSSILYHMSKAILLENLGRQESELSSDILSSQNQPALQRRNGLGKIQTLILLVAYASWAQKDMLLDAIFLGQRLSTLLRQFGITDTLESTYVDDSLMSVAAEEEAWCKWVAAEERRRTLLSAYVLHNLHHLAYDVPLELKSGEICLALPSCEESWKASSPSQWLQSNFHGRRGLQETLMSLLRGRVYPVSSFANYVLIHSLLQEFTHLNADGIRCPLDPETANMLETALRTWQLSWERTYESTLDPLSKKGPLGLNATALLRWAYIRLSSNMAPCRILRSREVNDLVLGRSCLDRSSRLDRAILHAAHALSIPVRLGLELIANIRLPFRSIEYSLSSLDCALLLRDWLAMIATITKSNGPDALRKTERKLLDIITHGNNDAEALGSNISRCPCS
ncbi:hypothetical protein AYO20_03156 [Fonsecaea nubica]|uniref:Xylanolytic transcriptional activator regulatory domain-containing protein n=1 Tax=Fonsecaea nubica TaxID=856822 RepID=A0A178D695_9EURO|nr:hypothetical protein AYO20_03156 [Fonsecaea nubica]OAL37649.1 hypothetical protein AYO20_03156 [Fonsecaea nubica]